MDGACQAFLCFHEYYLLFRICSVFVCIPKQLLSTHFAEVYITVYPLELGHMCSVQEPPMFDLPMVAQIATAAHRDL